MLFIHIQSDNIKTGLFRTFVIKRYLNDVTASMYKL